MRRGGLWVLCFLTISMSKFMIAVDYEGLACVVGSNSAAPDNFAFARREAAREASAAARALFDGGASQVLVWDNHGNGENIWYDRLDPRCEILMGVGFNRRFPGLDESFEGVLMVGYHAMEGVENAVLSHTYSHAGYSGIEVGGKPVGEIPLDASVAGELGVPVIFLSSDDWGCSEGLRYLPWIENVTTKTGLGYNCARSKHPLVVENEIYAAVEKAMNNMDRMKPFGFEKPTNVTIRYRSFARALIARFRKKNWRFAGFKALERKYENMLEWQC